MNLKGEMAISLSSKPQLHPRKCEFTFSESSDWDDRAGAAWAFQRKRSGPYLKIPTVSRMKKDTYDLTTGFVMLSVGA